MGKSFEEHAKEVEEKVVSELRDAFDSHQKAAEEARADEPDNAETEEQYYERVNNVPGIFGDVNTAVGPQQPVSARQQDAGANIAEAEASDDVPDDVTESEVVRQPDVALGTVPSAEEANAAIEKQEAAPQSSKPVVEEPVEGAAVVDPATLPENQHPSEEAAHQV